jgi:phage terminase large subunit-like protein
MRIAEPGFEFVGGLDLGVSRDASAICILGIHRGATNHGRIRLAFTRVWRPAAGEKVNLQEIEDALLRLNYRFHLATLAYDPWQATHMAQRIGAAGIGIAEKKLRRLNGEPIPTSRVPMVEVPQVGASLQKMATVVIEAFNDRRVELYDDADLRRDLTALSVEERSYGFRLIAQHDAFGHGDLGSAFVLAMLAASELAGKRPPIVAGPMMSDSPSDGGIFGDFTRRQQEYSDRMNELHAAGFDYNGAEQFSAAIQSLRRF